MNNEKNPTMTDIDEQKAIIAQAQAELDKKMHDLLKQQEHERQIEKQQKFLEQDIKIGKEQVAATKKFEKALNDAAGYLKFGIVLSETESDRSVYDYDRDTKTKVLVCEIKGMVPRAYIKFSPDESYVIGVEEHYVTSGWHSVNKGYKMSITGGMGWEAARKTYINAKTVIKKIEDHYNDKLAEAARKKAIEDLRKNTDWGQMYPNATVTQESMYEGGWRRGKYDKYANLFMATKIVLANGVTVVMKPYADGTWVIWNVKFPTPEVPKGTANEVLNALNNMAF